jgi:multidrug transporter EmrE-like cation transporter
MDFERIKGEQMLQHVFTSIPKWLYFLIVLVLFELVADILAKQFAMSGRYSFAILSTVGFIAANIAWLISLRVGAELGKGAVLFSALSAIGAVMVATFLYHEKVTSYRVIGLILGIAAIIFLSID